MIDKSSLEALPDDVELDCYKCKEAPAIMFRWMKTPSGGKYRRGWCGDCIEGRTTSTKQKDEATQAYAGTDCAYKVGNRVLVSFEGKVLYFSAPKDKSVTILVGTRAYTVPRDACTLI